MLPPDGDPRTWLAFDHDGEAWLLKWDIPGAPDVWSATGYDKRKYPAASVPKRSQYHTIHPVASQPHKVSRTELEKRFRELTSGK